MNGVVLIDPDDNQAIEEMLRVTAEIMAKKKQG